MHFASPSTGAVLPRTLTEDKVKHQAIILYLLEGDGQRRAEWSGLRTSQGSDQLQRVGHQEVVKKPRTPTVSIYLLVWRCEPPWQLWQEERLQPWKEAQAR